MSYTVLKRKIYNIAELEADVQEFMKRGWSLAGGVAVSDGYIYQALCRKLGDDTHKIGFTNAYPRPYDTGIGVIER